MKLAKTLGILALSVFYLPLKGQVPIGEWRDHLPYSKAIGVSYSGSVVYSATEHAIVKYDLSDYSIERLSKVNALSDININYIRYSTTTSTLVVAYSNGNLDLVKEDGTINLAFIKNDDDIVGDKTIYHIYCEGDLAYLSCGFGIVVVDISREEIKDTYLIGNNAAFLKVNGITSDDTYIYAATENGLYRATLSNQFLNDFNQWTRLTDIPNFGGPFSLVNVFDDRVFVNYDNTQFDSDTLYYYDGANWQVYTNVVGQDNNSLETNGTELLITHNYGLEWFDTNDQLVNFISTYGYASPQPNQAVHGNNTSKWIADQRKGLVLSSNAHSFVPQGPQSISVFDIEIQEGEVWVAAGGVQGSAWNNLNNHDGVYHLNDNNWTTFNDVTTTTIGDSMVDFLSVAINPENSGQVFAGAFSRAGIVEFNDGSVDNIYNVTNSTLSPNTTNHPNWVGAGAMTIDNDENLWVACSKTTSNPLSVRTPDGTWAALPFCGNLGSQPVYSAMLVDDLGYVWVAAPSKGIIVYDANGTPTDVNDDNCKLLNSAVGNGNLPTNDVNCFVEDLDYEIWVGTNEGVVVFYNPEDVFTNNNFDSEQVLIEQDGNLQLLLATEVVTAITIDGANRKWIGTSNSGAFLMSSDGTEQILHFTAENSPLFSNNISDIAIDHENGEVYFGTDKGIISYRGVATGGSVLFSDSVYAFPNPVRESYYGNIAITGLVRDSDVKITDITGSVVHVTKSKGGQAIWDGNNLSGIRAKTGVYLVFATDKKGQQAVVTKILLVN
jgi:ligand-binding sensor domain-containing protein